MKKMTFFNVFLANDDFDNGDIDIDQIKCYLPIPEEVHAKIKSKNTQFLKKIIVCNFTMMYYTCPCIEDCNSCILQME